MDRKLHRCTFEMATLLGDLRYAIRHLRKNPGFTTVILLTLALCIGSNLAIFAVVDSILLRPLPFPESDRLVLMYNSYPKAGKLRDGASLTSYYERRGHIPAFSQIASLNYSTTIVGEAGSTERVESGRVSPEFFSTLGTRMALGRAFVESEMTYQTDGSVILTNSYWREQFNSDPNVVGRTVRTDGFNRKVVGVLPPGFRFLSSKARIFLPLSSEEGERSLGARHANNDVQIARLAPGVTIAQAQAQIDQHNDAHAAEFPFAKEVAASGFRTIVVQLHADHVASVRPVVILLQAGALFLLLIGGVNLVNLLLIRSSGRAKEMAVRQSMGATRWHVTCQVLTETILLTLLGGLCGLWVAEGGIRILEVLGADRLPLGANISLDGRLAAIALGSSVLLGLLIALPIVWFNLGAHLANTMQSESRSGTISRSAQRVRYGFIVAQITVAFMLLSGAGLLGLSLQRAMNVSPGFQSSHVITAQISLPWYSYHDGPSFIAFTDRFLEAAHHQPGLLAVGGISGLPLSGGYATDAIGAVGYNPAPGESIVMNPTYGVFGNYFAALGIPLRAGRYLEADDNHRGERVCVVDEVFARKYWPHGNAVGQRVFTVPRKADDSNVFTIVGVVASVKQQQLTEHQGSGALYFPFIVTFNRNYFLVARTAMPPEILGDSLRKSVRHADPDLPVSDVRSMESRIDDSLITRRSPALLTGIFAGAALLLAAIGTYGVLSFAVSQRHREIGVRMALGALPQRILTEFLRLGGKLLGAGVLLGFVGALAAGRAMQSLLFGVGAFESGVLALSAVVMLAAVWLACYVPARRAAKVDPMVALRNE